MTENEIVLDDKSKRALRQCYRILLELANEAEQDDQPSEQDEYIIELEGDECYDDAN